MEENRKKTLNLIDLLLGLILIALFVCLFWNSGIVKGLNDRADILRTYTRASCEDNGVCPGDILDRNGTELAVTSYVEKKDEKGKVKERGFVTKYTDGKAYAQLLGYSGKRTLNRFVDSPDEVIGSRSSAYRLMRYLGEGEWADNGLYTPTDANSEKGRTVTLTIDHNLQMEVCRILQNTMSDTESKGSAVVMDARTGEILSMVSFPTYDFNDLKTAKQQMAEAEQSLEAGFPITTKNSETPGSIFKVFMSLALLDNGMEDFTAVDQGFDVDGYLVRNAYSDIGDRINYVTALERSSNAFFAQAALALGEERLNEQAAKFGMFSDQAAYEQPAEQEKNDGAESEENEEEQKETKVTDRSYAMLDLGSVNYNWNLVPDEKQSRELLIAQTGYGQGKVELTSLYAAMMMDAVANEGKVMKPYLVDHLTNDRGTVTYQGKPSVYLEAASKKAARKVKDALLKTAEYTLNTHRVSDATRQRFRTYQIAGKTGTGERGNGTNNAWYISLAPADDPEYVVVVNQSDTEKAGYMMMDAVGQIYEYLLKEQTE